jgi:pilus assembly protein CpaC
MTGVKERSGRLAKRYSAITAFRLLLWLALPVTSLPWPALAAEIEVLPTSVEAPINLPVGYGRIVRFEEAVDSVFLADPGVADLKVVAADVIYLFGKKSGSTNLIALGGDQKVKAKLQLRVFVDPTPLGDAKRGMHPTSMVDVAVIGSRVVAVGRNRTIEEATNVDNLAKTFSPPGQLPLNDTTLDGSNQVNIRVRFVEVSRNDLQAYGFDWNLFAKTGSFLFGKVDVDVMIEALRRAGALSILAEPNLTAVTGQTASFLAGGETPVPVPSGQGNLITAQYKPFGVSLEFTPTLIRTNRIALRVRPEVSALSRMGAVKVGGVDLPSFTVRRADTTVEVASGQTFAIGGLFQRQMSEDTDKVPGLSEVPVLGQLFQSTRFRRDETELVILVTPYLVKPTSGRLPTPLDRRIAPPPPARPSQRVASKPEGRFGFIDK